MSKTITISDDIYEMIKNQLGLEEKIDLSSFEDLIGKKWFFRTVTYHMVGEAVKIFGNFIQLKDAAWIADSGRFTQAIKNGVFNEVEPVGDCFVNIGSVVDFFSWKHKLPLEQK